MSHEIEPHISELLSNVHSQSNIVYVPAKILLIPIKKNEIISNNIFLNMFLFLKD